MKRLLPILIVVVIAAAGIAAGLTAESSAVDVNGATVSVNTINDQMHAFDQTQGGQCYLSLGSDGEGIVTQGAGGQGTYAMSFADGVVDQAATHLLAEQYARSLGITVSSSDLAQAKTELASDFDSEIQSVLTAAESAGTGSACVTDQGQAVTGAALLDSLPSSFSQDQIRFAAYEQELLARGADLSPAAISAYYNANVSDFVTYCLSGIAVSSQSEAQSLIDQINGGASFAAVAKANSLDTESAPGGGALGCTFTEAEIVQQLGVTSVPVGKPFGLSTDQSTGDAEFFEVTSQQTQSLADATPAVRQALLFDTANTNRIQAEINAYARRSDVSIDPRYGSWKVSTIVPPTSPPAKILLPTTASSLASEEAAAAEAAGEAGATGATGTSGTSGPSGTSGTSGTTGAAGAAGTAGSGASGSSAGAGS